MNMQMSDRAMRFLALICDRTFRDADGHVTRFWCAGERWHADGPVETVGGGGDRAILTSLVRRGYITQRMPCGYASTEEGILAREKLREAGVDFHDVR